MTAILCRPPKNLFRDQKALLAAITNGDGRMVELLVEHGANIYQVNEDDAFSLHLAAALSHNSICNTLLDQGIDVDYKGDYAYILLMVAAFRGHRAVFDLLLSKFANANAVNSEGISVLLSLRYRRGCYASLSAGNCTTMELENEDY